MKNSDYVNNWRYKKGNQIRKNRYKYLRDMGVDYQDAMKMRFWSLSRIKDWLNKNGYKVDDLNA